MKAAVLRQFGQPLQMEEVPTPTIGPEEALIQVIACGTDRTDLKMVEGFGYTPELPFILGHEIAGIVSEVGARVTDLKIGDRVIAYNFASCGRCLFCRTQREQLCLNVFGPIRSNMSGGIGSQRKHGGYAEYVAVAQRQLIRLPGNVSWPDAAVIPDAAITALHALDRARVRLGETVVVLGVGGVGAFGVQIAKLSGARVVAVDRSPQKIQFAYDMGADEAFDSAVTDIPKAVKDLTGGLGAECVVDFVGVEQTIAAGLDSLRCGGRLTIVGYTPEIYGFNGKRIAQNELEIIGTRNGRLQDLVNAAHLVAGGKLKSIVTQLFPLEEVNTAMETLRSGKVLGRAVLLTPAGRRAVGRNPL